MSQRRGSPEVSYVCDLRRVPEHFWAFVFLSVKWSAPSSLGSVSSLETIPGGKLWVAPQRWSCLHLEGKVCLSPGTSQPQLVEGKSCTDWVGGWFLWGLCQGTRTREQRGHLWRGRHRWPWTNSWVSDTSDSLSVEWVWFCNWLLRLSCGFIEMLNFLAQYLELTLKHLFDAEYYCFCY